MFANTKQKIEYRAITSLARKHFVLNNKRYEYYRGKTNKAYKTERTVELPVVKRMVDACQGRILEVGNVLYNYYPCNHMVIDKYEKADHVLNVDVCDYHRPKYDLIVSISTLEHVGYDEPDADPHKIERAIDNLTNLLMPGGILFFTFPTGYNHEFDEKILENRYGFRLAALERDTRLNEWWQVPLTSPLRSYDTPYRYGNMVIFARYDRRQPR
jgi:SAM-dependent methyltransferase